MTSVEFSSATFTGSESSGEIIVTITATGTISDNIDVMITLTEGTAKGLHIDCLKNSESNA